MIDKRSVDGRIGLKIKIRRNQVGLTQTALANKLGVTFQQIQKYEKGTNKVSISKLYKIADILDTDMDYFLGDDDVSYALNDLESKGSYNYSGQDKKEVKKEKQNRDEIATKKEIINLVNYFTNIKSKKMRIGIINMLKSCSQNEEE